MKYGGHYAGTVGIHPSFGFVVDDETMRWKSVPPGHDLSKPLGPTYLPCEGGALGKGKIFTLYPGGAVRAGGSEGGRSASE